MIMDHNTTIMTVSSIIEIALAPVFLLTGIAAVLSMLTVRLARVVDRWRLLDGRVKKMSEDERAPIISESRIIWRRIKLISWSIRLAVTSALLVCVIISLLFLGDFAAPFVGGSIAYLFVATMVVMTLSFSTLLAEVSISTKWLRQKMEHALHDEPAD
jgi:hypothetical protein